MWRARIRWTSTGAISDAAGVGLGLEAPLPEGDGERGTRGSRGLRHPPIVLRQNLAQQILGHHRPIACTARRAQKRTHTSITLCGRRVSRDGAPAAPPLALL